MSYKSKMFYQVSLGFHILCRHEWMVIKALRGFPQFDGFASKYAELTYIFETSLHFYVDYIQ